MFARIGVMRALNRHVERVFDTSRKFRIIAASILTADHFGNCPVCGACRHARPCQILAHVHDAEIEIGGGPEPPMREGLLQ